jgi:hypothetical protein
MKDPERFIPVLLFALALSLLAIAIVQERDLTKTHGTNVGHIKE